MPSVPPPRKGYPLQWVHIDDFSPGGYDGSHVSTEQPEVSAPLGASQFQNTFCCAVIPGGALGPLPALTTQLALNTLTGGLPGTSSLALVTGFIITPQLNDGHYEVVVLLEADDGTHHYVQGWSYEPSVGSPHSIGNVTNTSATTPGFFGAPYPAFTRMNASGSGTPPPGPILVFPGAVITDASGANGHLWIYPELLSPTSYVAQDLIVSGSSITGQVITYGNRVICIAGVTYQWPTGGGINTNENFNYTDPPESSTYGNQQTIFAVETPWGYGAWGTVSVGELLLVKKYGGAVILNGDINTPTSIIRVPEVQSTGDFVGRAAATPIGLIYCSQNQGAWVWNGGNAAQKISRNIDDNFFDLETNVVGTNNYGFNVEHWQKWVLFSNNVIYDTETNSWWQLYPRHGVNPIGLTGHNLWWYSLTQNGNQMLAAPLTITNGADPVYSVFDNTVPSPTYQWQSLPLNIGSPDRTIDIRQIIIRASDPTNTGTATVEVKVGSFDQTSTTTIGASPTTIRFNVGNGAQGIDSPVLTLIAHNPTSLGSAPIIHSIDLGYNIRAGVGVTD